MRTTLEITIESFILPRNNKQISFNDLDLKNGNAVTTQIIFICRVTLRFDQHNITGAKLV